MRVLPDKALDKLSREELVSHLEVLQRHYKDLRTQRDDLKRDVDLLCLDSGSATFDLNSFLKERCRAAEAELAQLKQEVSAVTVELYDVKEDCVLLREAKRVSDASARQATQAAARSQEDLAFYQSQAAEAMRARDKANSDAASARGLHAELQKRCSQQDAQLRQEQAALGDAELRVSQQAAEIEGLSKRAAVAEQVPGLQRDLKACRAELRTASSERDDLRAKLSEAQEHGAGLQQKLDAAVAAQEKLAARLEQQRASAAAAADDLQVRLDASEGESSGRAQRVAQLEARVAEVEAAEARLRGEQASSSEQARARFDSELTEKENALGEQTGRLDALGEQLAASRQACEEAEGRVSGLQSDVRGRAEELAAAQATVDDLQGKLQEVAAEKMRLLMENAELKEVARDVGTSERTDGDDSWAAWPWKSDFNSRGSNSLQANNEPRGKPASRTARGWLARGPRAAPAEGSQE